MGKQAAQSVERGGSAGPLELVVASGRSTARELYQRGSAQVGRLSIKDLWVQKAP